MEKLITILAIILFGNSAYSQENGEELDVTVQVSNASKVERKVNSFLVENGIEPATFSSSNRTIIYSIFITETEVYKEFDKKIESFGYVSSKTRKGKMFKSQVTLVEYDLKIETDNLEKYKALLKERDEKELDCKYIELNNRIIEIENKIIALKKKQKSVIDGEYKYTVRLVIKEEPAAGSYYDESWVNMPGLEYSFLNTENSVEGVTPESMSGISLKYLFNTTKSYGILGVYKANDTKNDTEVSEIYTFAFGQDFYSRTFGKGKRQFLNPYTSINVGASVSSSEIDRTFTWFMNPYVGIELIKNKYMLLDTKVGYFLPYKENRNQRGLLLNASLNIIF